MRAFMVTSRASYVVALILVAACGRSGEPSGAAPRVAPAESSSTDPASGGSGETASSSAGRGESARAAASPPLAATGQPGATTSPPVISGHPIARIETSMGTIRAQLDPEHAPRTVANFVQYVSDHFYDGTIFHRVIDDFMIQGGGFEPGMRRKPTRAPIPLEIHPALRHIDGAIAMARTSDPNSATAQFYICDGPQNRLDDGYAPFGRVIEGMDVVRRIAAVQTGPGDQPVTDVVIRSVRMEE